MCNVHNVYIVCHVCNVYKVYIVYTEYNVYSVSGLIYIVYFIYIYIYIYLYGRVKSTSYPELLTNLIVYTVLEQIELNCWCWLLAGRSGRVFFGRGCFGAGLARA